MITGLDTWLEAWSIYAGVLVSYKPELAPDLFRYQNFITQQSRRFKAYAWLQYDAQFRLKLASNPSIKWSDSDTELIATWLSADAAREKPACFACGNPEHLASDCPWKVSGTSNSSVLNCPVCNASGHAARDCPKLGQPAPPPADTHHAGADVATVFEAQGVHTCTPVPTAREVIPNEPAPGSPVDPLPIHLHTIHTPLRPQVFAQFLNKHPDKAFTSKLLHSLEYGFDIGYHGPHTPLIARNLHSALEHPKVIDEALQKEVTNNRIAGSYRTLPFDNLRCSGLGILQKKDGSCTSW